jgi:V/A-type H+/Na+-transporting ATPase subunit E
MSTARIKEGLEGIASEVLADVQKEAEITILKAEKEAKETLKVAKDDSDKIYATIMAEAMTKASSERIKMDSKADVEVRNRLLKIKDALVESIFEKAQLRLFDFVSEGTYNEFLLKLIEEAARKIGSKKVTIQVNSKDKVWLTEENIGILSKRLRVDLILAEETIPCIGGCKVQTTDGKLVYDNTFENRIEQLRPALRLEVAKILFQKEESPNVS